MKKNYILIFLTTFLLMFISTAYAAFSSELIISGEGIVEKDTIPPTCGSWYLRDSSLTIQEAFDQNKFKNPATNTEWTTENQSLFIECTDNMAGDYGCINVTEITDSNNQKRYYKEVKEYTTSVKTDSNVVTVKLQDAYLNERTCSLPVGGSNPYLDKQGPTITITATAANKFTYSATDDMGVTGYMVTTSSTKPAIDDANWLTTPKEITIDNTAAKTYYVWAKDGVNITSKTIKTYKLTKTVGTGTTLTLKYKNSTGVELTTGYVLNGTKVYIKGSLLDGYNTLELKKGTTVIASGSTQTISAATTISSSATPNIYSIELDNQGANESGKIKVWYKYKTVTSGCYYYTDSKLTTCLENDTITKPEKDGYTYAGYYSGLNGAGTNYVNSSGSFINNIYQKLPSEINTNYTDEITLYATWTAKSYTVTADAQGGSISSTTGWTGTGNTSTKSVTYNQPYGTLPTVSRAGYTFKGWSKENLFTPSQNNTKNYLNYTLNILDGIYSLDGVVSDYAANGQAYDLMNVNIGANYAYYMSEPYNKNTNTISLNSGTYTLYIDKISGDTPTKRTYIGAKKYSDGAAIGDIHLEKDETSVTFTLNTETELYFYLDFVTNGQVFNNFKFKVYLVKSDLQYITSSSIVKTADNHNIYAHWTPNELVFENKTVSSTFNASTAQTITNGITAATNGTGTYTYAITDGNDNNYFSLSGRNIVIAKNTPANTTGYNVTIKATDSNSGATKSATYTIKVNKGTCPVPTSLAIANTGIVTWTKPSAAASSEISIDNTTFTSATSGVNYNSTITATTGSRTVYVRSVCDSTNYTSPSTSVSKATTVYSVSLTKGTGISTVTGAGNYITGSAATIDATVNTGYTWKNWTGTSTLTSKANIITVNGNKSYTANTTLNTYSIEYVLNGGTATNPDSYNVTTNTFTLNNPVKTGYTFLGWTGSNGSTPSTSVSITKGSTGNKNYTANYSIIDPEAPTISGNSTRVYNYAGRTLTCSTTSTYASGTNIYYEFGYASSAANWTAGTITWLGNPSTTNTYAVLKNAYIGTRYYGCRIYASDGTETTTKINTASSVDQSFVNARVYFDVATNGGTISGSANLYMPYGMTNIYTSRTSHATAGTLPVATKAGYTFDGWYTAATGGTKVIGSDRVVQASVSGWTDANKNWLRTSTSNNTTANKLYAQFTYDEEPTITRNDYNTFTVSGTAASEYFISKTQTTAPNASATGWSTTATQDVSTTSKETWYVWIKDSDGNVSPNSKTITNFKVTLTIGEGTTLTLKYNNSTGVDLTTGYVLKGTNIYVSGSLNTEYNNLTITKNNVNIANPSTITVDDNITISSSADFNGIYVTFDPTGGSVDPTRKGVVTGNIYGILPTPDKQGYTFAGWSKLPDGYDELEYIESTGTQWIDTGVSSSIIYKLQFNYMPIGNVSTYDTYLGGTLDNFTLARYSSNSTAYLRLRTTEISHSINVYTNAINTLIIDGNQKTITHNNQTFTTQAVGALQSTTGNLFIGNHNSTTNSRPSKTRIYGLILYDSSDEILRNYVPAVNKSTGKAGLYDLVNGVFYGNSGTGDFVEGPKYGSVTSSSIVTASTNHTLRAMYNVNKYNLIWDLNNVNNMNSWSFNGNYTFDISYDETSKMNSISVTGASGLWEIAYLPITTIAGKNYKIEFDYYNPNGYTPLSGYNGIGAQALTSVVNNSNASYSLSTTTLSSTASSNIQHITLEFTATGTTTYLAFNFGMAADNLTTSVQIGNIKIIESMAYDSFIIDEPTLSPIGLTLNGFYTEKTGGSQHSLIDKMPNEDKTYYAQSTVKNYTITYNLDGGTNAASNPSTYNVNDLNLTLASPTKTGHTFKGWKTKNLFDPSGLDTSLNIVTNSDELMSSSNTTTDNRAWGYANSNLKLTLPVGTYTISFYFDSTTSNQYAQYGINYNGGSANSLAEGSLQNKWKVSRTFTVASGQTQVGIMFKIYEGKVRIQLEEGSNATPYIRSKVSGTVVSPPPSNQVFTAQWTKNNYNVTCEDYFVDRSNNLKVKLGTQSTTKSYAYGSSVSGSAWGTNTANSAYYSMYQYVGASTATVPANNNLKVYRYFTATSDINIYNPSGVQDNKSGTISISYNQGSSWYTGKTNEVQYTGFYYGDTVWVKDISPASGYVLKNVTGATLSNGIYKLTITAASQNILIYMGYKPDGTSKTFGYTGAVQTYTAPSAGTYKLEVCGAQGGSPVVSGITSKTGGKGGCATGNVTLTAGQTLYVFVGGAGGYTASSGQQMSGGWNGGGNTAVAGNYAAHWGAGGGATHISKSNATIANAGSNLLIVGGGGGGASTYAGEKIDGTNNIWFFQGDGGNGGGSSGSAGQEETRDGVHRSNPGGGGTQSTGGSAGTGGQAGSKGQGGNGSAGTDGTGGGGGGYYGGGSGGSRATGGGGGSGYIGGVSSGSWSSTSCQNSGTYRTGNGCAKITKQ